MQADTLWQKDYRYVCDDATSMIHCLHYEGTGHDVEVPSCAVIGGKKYLVKIGGRTFKDCKDIESVTFGQGIVLKENLSEIFSGCLKMKKADMSGAYAPHGYDMSRGFFGCGSLLSVSFPSGAGCVQANSLFDECRSLKSFDFSSVDTSECEDMCYMFNNCVSLGCVLFDSLTFARMKYAIAMFRGCSSLRSIDFTGCRMESCCTVSGMFRGCASLKTSVISGIAFTRCSSAKEAFMGCLSLRSVDLSRSSFPSCIDFSSCFEDCVNLRRLDMSGTSVMRDADIRDAACRCRLLTDFLLSHDACSLLAENMPLAGINIRLASILEAAGGFADRNSGFSVSVSLSNDGILNPRIEGEASDGCTLEKFSEEFYDADQFSMENWKCRALYSISQDKKEQTRKENN